jgi:RHS repeat-associated protein
VITNSGSANGTIYYVHDQWGNIIAELDATGATVREYIWLVEAEIAPTRSRTQVDRPLVVVTNVNTATPGFFLVHVDQLNRPVKMTDWAKTVRWSAVWTPWGAPHSITSAPSLDMRFPGQFFQLEAGLHYNWHRHYDPSLGRYTQPDPLGFVDGSSVYAYAGSSPETFVDPNGRLRLGPMTSPEIVIPRTPPPPPIPGTPPSLPLPTPSPNPGGTPNSGGERDMPPIWDPEDPGNRQCRCRCRATDRSAQQSYFAARTSDTCEQATRDACKAARKHCQVGDGDVHHQEARCSDGTVRNGGGRVLGRFRYDG